MDHRTTGGEDELVAGCRRRDALALQHVAQEFGPRIYRWAYARTGSPEEADDVMQDTLVRFLETLDAYEGRCALSTWLYRLSHHLILNRRRNRSIEESARLRAPARAVTGEISNALDVVRTLDPDLRPVMVLFYVEGLRVSEICDVLELPASTVKWRLFEGRKELRMRLKEGRHEL